MHGNALSLTTGQQDVFRANLSRYLSGLEEKEYPYDKISLQFSGYITDNSPPSMKVCDIIREWNEKYEWPKLRSALARDFMVYLDEEHADDIPAQEVAWPDWWTDGVGSAANETKVVRNTHVEVASSEAILSMATLLGADFPADIQRDIEAVYDNLLFYDEHTHGAAESVTDPLAQNSVNQWGMKSAYAWEAAKRSSLLQEKALAFLEPALNKSSLPTIAIFNTLNWKRSGMVHLFMDYDLIPENKTFTITGPEALNLKFEGMMTMEYRMGKATTIAPGKSLDFPLPELRYGGRNSSRWLLAAPGDYKIKLAFQTNIEKEKLNIDSNEITLVVKE